MASRAQQKEEARQHRLQAEQEAAQAIDRLRRNQRLAGVALLALVLVGVAVAVSSKGNPGPPRLGSPRQKAIAAKVQALLAGIPQAGNRIGNPTAKVTVTEFGDLECPVCRDFALGGEQHLIASDVRSGKVQLIYRSFCTATCNSDKSVFAPQQAAALAAGLQGHEWNYIDLFYNEQGAEGTGYVTSSYLDSLASQIPGLDYGKWLSDRSSHALTTQVGSDQQEALARGFSGTPTILVQGPKGQTGPAGNFDYGTLESMIRRVS